MDQIDRKILELLQRDAKQNTKEIARKVGLSVTPTYERIKKLEQQQVIKSYVALVDPAKVGKEMVVYCQINLLKHQKVLIDNFEDKITNFPEIMECHHVSGNFDFLLKIVVKDIKEFHHFVNEKLAVVDGISTIQSSFVMNSTINNSSFVV